jgi:scyllo-inositol 2-dehydrogenase (NADP+)
MKSIVVGLGVQGKKRVHFAAENLQYTVDNQVATADYKFLEDVPLSSYECAILCVPDKPKYELIKYLISNKKHVLVEKPLWVQDPNQIWELQKLALENGVLLRTAYNHRFEPNIVRLRKAVKSGSLGKIHSLSIYYGNGTANLVKDSIWRDSGSGVLLDLGSHLLDMVSYIFEGNIEFNYECFLSNFENRAPDHALMFSRNTSTLVLLEMTLCMWKNTFRCEIIGSEGSAHIFGLCKWSDSIYSYRRRIFPSGIPEESTEIEPSGDPTWKLEYEDFLESVLQGEKTNLSNDFHILSTLTNLRRVGFENEDAN